MWIQKSYFENFFSPSWRKRWWLPNLVKAIKSLDNRVAEVECLTKHNGHVWCIKDKNDIKLGGVEYHYRCELCGAEDKIVRDGPEWKSRRGTRKELRMFNERTSEKE